MKKSSFYKLFKKYFGPKRIDKSLPRIRISKYSTHSRCDECTQLEEGRKNIKNSADLKNIRERTERHRKEYGKARLEVTRLIQLSQSHPREYLALQIDDMDNTKSYLPKILEPGKKLVNMNKLKSKITGCIMNNGLYERMDYMKEEEKSSS